MYGNYYCFSLSPPPKYQYLYPVNPPVPHRILSVFGTLRSKVWANFLSNSNIPIMCSRWAFKFCLWCCVAYYNNNNIYIQEAERKLKEVTKHSGDVADLMKLFRTLEQTLVQSVDYKNLSCLSISQTFSSLVLAACNHSCPHTKK